MKLDERTVADHIKNLYGYVEKTEDRPLILHLITSAETLIKNFCHISSIPEGAVHPAIDYICGKFLQQKIATGTLTDPDGNDLYYFNAPETSITMGNVSVSYESGYGSLTDNNALLSQINQLADETNFKKKIVHFRKIKWK